jgi:SET domain-containing protein
MERDDVIVGKSEIHGKGVFALKDFKKGDLVMSWDVSLTATFDEIEVMDDEDKEYINFLNGKYVVMQEPEKYVNHSCKPNTEVKNFCDIAIKDIKKDEEITSDYTKTLPPGVYFECRCECIGCKKIIKSKSTQEL